MEGLMQLALQKLFSPFCSDLLLSGCLNLSVLHGSSWRLCWTCHESLNVFSAWLSACRDILPVYLLRVAFVGSRSRPIFHFFFDCRAFALGCKIIAVPSVCMVPLLNSISLRLFLDAVVKSKHWVVLCCIKRVILSLIFRLRNSVQGLEVVVGAFLVGYGMQDAGTIHAIWLSLFRHTLVNGYVGWLIHRSYEPTHFVEPTVPPWRE